MLVCECWCVTDAKLLFFPTLRCVLCDGPQHLLRRLSSSAFHACRYPLNFLCSRVHVRGRHRGLCSSASLPLQSLQLLLHRGDGLFQLCQLSRPTPRQDGSAVREVNSDWQGRHRQSSGVQPLRPLTEKETRQGRSSRAGRMSTFDCKERGVAIGGDGMWCGGEGRGGRGVGRTSVLCWSNCLSTPQGPHPQNPPTQTTRTPHHTQRTERERSGEKERSLANTPSLHADQVAEGGRNTSLHERFTEGLSTGLT